MSPVCCTHIGEHIDAISGKQCPLVVALMYYMHMSEETAHLDSLLVPDMR